MHHTLSLSQAHAYVIFKLYSLHHTLKDLSFRHMLIQLVQFASYPIDDYHRHILLKEYCLHHSLKMIFSGTMLILKKNILCIITLVPYTTLIHSVLSFHKHGVL